MIGDTPEELIKRYPDAFEMVVSELAGPPEVQQRMHADREDFLQLLGDSRKAGQFAAQVLDGLDWDWPRWHAYAKASFLAHDTLTDLRHQASCMKPVEGLNMMTVAQLKAVTKRQELNLPGKLQKAELVAAIKALRPDTWSPEAKAQIQLWLTRKELACRREMGAAMASRVAHIALEKLKLQQRIDPGYLALRPNWRFECEGPSWGLDKPKDCKRLHGKVLPATEALLSFPALPCERLFCMCEIVTCK